MNIIMFGQKDLPSRAGGIEVAVEELATRMAAKGHRVLCCNRRMNSSKKYSEYRGVQLRTVPTIQGKGLAAVSAAFFAALYAMFSDCDVVHIHGEGPAFFGFLPKLCGKYVLVTIHGLDWDREKWKGSFASCFLYWGEKMALRFADEIIVLSQSAEEYFLQKYQRQTVRIPNGCSRSEELPPNNIRKRFGLERDSYLLFVGRFVPEKGVHHLIEAFLHLKTDKKLVIAGVSSDSDDYVRHLYNLAEGEERILFTGFVEGSLLEELYSNCYLYLLPSSLEGMPLTLLEAMSHGACCVTSDIPECQEVIGESGCCVEVGQGSELRDCLQQLCDKPILVEEFRRKARARSTQLESWDTVTEQTLNQYEILLNRRHKHENSAGQ